VQDGCALECSQGTERSAVVTDTEHRAGRRRDGSSTRMLTEVAVDRRTGAWCFTPS
jgi:hypothetical protein